MSRLQTHIEDTRIILRQPDGMIEVHKWLDEFARKWKPHIHGEYHRKFRHNRKGVEEVNERFGHLGCSAAKIHLIRDVELYILKKPMHEVGYHELDELVERSFQYFPPMDIPTKWTG
jgi:hypothetical protein